MYPIEYVWPEWRIVRELGEGSYGQVYEIVRGDIGGEYHAAMKVISVPKNPAEFNILLNEGMDERSATSYFQGMMVDIVKEFALMEKLKGNTNIVSYEDHAIVSHEDGHGWDIIIRMELLYSFDEYLRYQEITEGEVIRVGISICRALELCERYNIIHRDIKPENIFVNAVGEYKLGDFGIARTTNTSGMSQKGTLNYMAPEVYRGGTYDASVDIYSLGMVLYRMLNNNRLPFMPPYPQDISYSDKETAVLRRLSGEKVPMPAYGSNELIGVVLKACAPYPSGRYRNASEMLRDLEIVAAGGCISNQEIPMDTVVLEANRTMDMTSNTGPDVSIPVQEKEDNGRALSRVEKRLEKQYQKEVIRSYKRKARFRRRLILLIILLILVGAGWHYKEKTGMEISAAGFFMVDEETGEKGLGAKLKEKFWDIVDSDGLIRKYLGEYNEITDIISAEKHTEEDSAENPVENEKEGSESNP